MPPEPYRWDRKRERSSESLGSYVSRWRETPHHHRWGSPDFRRPSGHGRQGGWHLPSEASGHGFAPTRSIDKILDDESCRPEGKYFRNSRENKGSFRQNYCWKGQSWETATLPNGPGRPADVNSQRSVNDKRMFNSHSHSDFVNNWDKFHVKDKHDENDGVSGLGTGERFMRENSLGSIDLKSFKWTRSGSLSSRGSGFSHSSSSKSIGVDISNTKVDATQAVVSPSGDATACVTSAAPNEDTSSRKKPRLRWGEGLAKFEKKKVEVPDDDGTKNGMSVCGSDAGPLLSHALNVADKSPRVTSFSDCASPATPSSVACSSSPGTDEKSFVKLANVDTGTSNLSASSCLLSQNHSEDLAFDLENLDLISVPNLSSSLNKLLQSDDASSLDSAFAKSTAMKKLLIWKADISKALEVTESEIDSLENELKSLIYHCGSDCPCPAASSSLPVVCSEKPCDEPCAPFDLISSRDMVMEKTLRAPEEENGVVKDEGIDSPGTATSKSVEPLPLGKTDSPSDIACGDGIQLITNNSVDSLSTEGVRCDRDIILYDLIIASNKDTANRASEVFSKLLPSDQCIIDISRAASSPCRAKDALIEEKFVKRKRFLRFKERVITLKYRAFQHLWKEDMRLLSMRRCCAKSQKRFELTSRTVHSGHQKHRSSSRSRFSSPAGNLSLVPTTEMVDFTSKLLSDSQVQIYRSTLKMPAMVLGNRGKMVSRFISSNGLVEDSCAVEKEKSMINPWTSDEREIFMDKLATCGKDFRKIASFLDHKTTADCVEFYYKNHKSDSFQRTKKKPDCEKKGKSHSTNTYLVTSGKRWNREINAASLDMLGAATAVAAANVDAILEMPGSLDDERETVAADVLAGICGSLSSEAMSSCITSSVDPGEGYQELKCHRVGSSTGRPLTPEVTQNVDDETCSDESYIEMTDPSDWTDQEKSIFVQAVALYGKDFTMISRRIGTKSSNQCKVFFSKARKCLGLDMMHRGPANEGMLTSDDANGDGSDTEDACLVETELGSKMDEELYLTNLKGNHNVYPGDLNRSEDCKEMELKPGKLVSYDYDLKAELNFNGDTNIENSVGSETPVLQAHENAFIPFDTEAGLNEDTGHATVEKSVSTKDANDSGGNAEKEVVGEVSGEYSGAVILGHELVIPESSSMHDVGAENSDANIAATSGLNCLTRYSNSAHQSVGNACLHAPESFHMSPTFDFDNLSRKQCQQTASTDDHHQHLTLSDRVESSQILRGYPVSTTNGMNVDISCERPALFQRISELDVNSHSDRYSSQNGFLQKCNSSKHHDSVAELQFLPHEQMRVDPRPQQLSSSDEVKPCRNGNVKLFGQILTNPASHHKPCSSKRENEDKVRQHSKLSGESSFNMKLKVDGKSAVSKIDLNNNSGLEDVPVRSSYGYWDGNRIQTGFPAIPDSAILLAKYPAAFSNYPMPLSNIQQQHQLPSVVNRNGENSNGVSVRQTRNRDDAKVQPFTVDMKQCQDILFSQMKRRSEINVVGRGGGISDPVAAIKMHYAKTEQYREEESWREKGNIGM